jgi:hypothetical protein
MKTAKKYPPLTQNKFIRQFLVRDSFGDLGDRLAEINEKRLSPIKSYIDRVKKKKPLKHV